MPRVCVLGLDGLEYDLVTRWNLVNLMQKQWGKIPVDPRLYYSDTGQPYTPMVWATFITGKMPEEHGIKSWWKQYRLAKLSRKPPFSCLKRWKTLRKLAVKLGVRVMDRQDLRVPSLFDLVKPSMAIHIPGYNFPIWIWDKIADALSKSVEEYARVTRGIYELEKRELLKAITSESEWKLVMMWTGIADFYGHAYLSRNPTAVEQVYRDLDLFAAEVASKLPEDSILLIVSDHGMTIGDDGEPKHSDHAFWSLNIETEWKPRSFTDFFGKILEWTAPTA